MSLFFKAVVKHNGNNNLLCDESKINIFYIKLNLVSLLINAAKFRTESPATTKL